MNEISRDESPTTVGHTAPRTKRVERQGREGSPLVEHYPEVRGGICEFCGVLDKSVPSEQQYRLCEHYRGMQLRCSYCDEAREPDEVIRKATMHITGHPDDPNKLVVRCDSYDCLKAHEERFKRNRTS